MKKQIHEYRARNNITDDVFGIINDRAKETPADKKDLRGKFCRHPFTYTEIDTTGEVYVCCSAHLSYPVGNVKQESLKDIWNGNKINAIRESILDGSFKYCNHTVCPYIVNDTLPDKKDTDGAVTDVPVEIGLNVDATCNLACPSCRNSVIDATPERINSGNAMIKNITDFVFDHPHDLNMVVRTNGAGDIFASKVTRDFVLNFDPRPWPNLKLSIMTHGGLFNRKYWDMMAKWHNKIHSMDISVDAATKETYELVRKGGDWDILHDNLRMLHSELKPSTPVFMHLIVQKNNYKEMIPFIEMCKEQYPKFRVVFRRISDWGTFKNFDEHAVWKNTHPEYENYKELLNTIITGIQTGKYNNVFKNGSDI